MNRFISLIIAAIVIALSVPCWASESLPGEGVRVRPARATWNTGYFQEVLVRMGLKELGYEVEKPKELQTSMFYQALTLGDVDYWPNGWFPMHNEQMPKNFYQHAEAVGYLLKAGGLQGYLVSKAAVEKYGISSLADFRRPEVIEAFDHDGDGKADLVACPPGWGCETTISYHLDVYGMNDYIYPIKAAYAASMADALANHRSGRPVFFFTWAPNWTIFKMKPGQDVMWINVPEIKARPVEAEAVDRMTLSGVEGAVSDPIKLGFVSADIRIVANKKFLKRNPAAAKFFELFRLPLQDINEQNTLMQDGEKSGKDIERHARLWIARNAGTWKAWIEEARRAAN